VVVVDRLHAPLDMEGDRNRWCNSGELRVVAAPSIQTQHGGVHSVQGDADFAGGAPAAAHVRATRRRQPTG